MSLNNNDINNISGVINIYKEKGFTSHDVVNIVRKNLNRIKTGHTGTLDPDAIGVLPICIGKATKLADYIASSTKEYKAVVSLGKTTTTQDASGEVLKEAPVICSQEDITEVVSSFVGEILQVPPMYSAIKVNGKKLYELAREGKEIERKKRSIHIYSISVGDINLNLNNSNKFEFEMTVLCSKGTYIRTLCYDIGEKLGCGAYMESLVRTKSGNFNIESAIKLEDFIAMVNSGDFDFNNNNLILSMSDILKGYPTCIVTKQASKFLYNGNKISSNYVKFSDNNKNNSDNSGDDKIVVYDEDGLLIGIYQQVDAFIKPVTMLI
ncbi:MAG: tRNA pseudouridine(55) synthase TruB [bacterium]